MPAIHTWIIIGVILVVVSVIIRIVAAKYHKGSIELVAILLVPTINLLFSDADSIDVRSIVVGYSFGVYVVSTIICHIVEWLIKRRIASKSVTNTDAQKQGLIVTLPVDSPFRIDQSFVDNLPADVDSLIYMCNEIGALTTDFINNFSECATDRNREEIIRSYFLGICYHILDFFDDSVRVHVRILKKVSENKYIYDKFVATFNKNEYNKAMQPMSEDNKMIQTSFKREQSLIASLNKELCEPGSRRKWKNFLTFALRSITYEDKPVFSIGISTARTKTDRLFFLNYCAIEAIIERYVEMMVNNTGCKEFIINRYFPSS